MTRRAETFSQRRELAQNWGEALRNHPASVLADRAAWDELFTDGDRFRGGPTVSVCIVRQATANPTVQAGLRSWPLDAAIRHLVLLDVTMIPSEADVDQWVTEAFGPTRRDTPAPTAIRTGALFPEAAEPFLTRGFAEVDRLALFERPLMGPGQPRKHPAPDGTSIARFRTRDLDGAAALDQAAFPDGWQQSARSLADIATATPQVRQRLALRGSVGRRHIVGFAITGKAGTTGYLQRLAVDPAAQRIGIARALVDDATDWLMRRGAHRVLVNTGVDNDGAIKLYEQASFTRRNEELVVLERRRAT